LHSELGSDRPGGAAVNHSAAAAVLQVYSPWKYTAVLQDCCTFQASMQVNCSAASIPSMYASMQKCAALFQELCNASSSSHASTLDLLLGTRRTDARITVDG
jgi:hypothetical protein